MSTSENTEFDRWLASLYSKVGGLTLLVVLAEIDGRRITPLCSTYFHVVGDEVDWDDVALMFAGSGQSWNAAGFFPTSAPNGGPIDNPTARLRLKELEAKVTKDRMTLNEGYFCDSLGRQIEVEPIADA